MARPRPRADLRVLGLFDQAESFATALQLIALGLSDTIPQEQAGAIAANATEILVRLAELKKLY
jgi:hypothetical protein